MKYEMTIPDVPPSLNQTLKLHWAERKKLKDTWLMWVRANMPLRCFRPIVQMRAKITLCHSRFYDKDNAYGAVKPLVDALKLHGLIFDDRKEWLDLTVEQAKAPRKAPKTIIELEAV